MDAYIRVKSLLENVKQLTRHNSFNDIFRVNAAEHQRIHLIEEIEMLDVILDDANKSNKRLEEIGNFEWMNLLSQSVSRLEDFLTVQIMKWNTGPLRRFFNGRWPISGKDIKYLREYALHPLLRSLGVTGFSATRTNLQIRFSSPQRKLHGVTKAFILPPEASSRNDTVVCKELAYRARLDVTIGLQDDMNVLIDSLTQDPENFGVVRIIGMSGIGKTTMARRIFNDLRIKDEFPNRIWINVSDELSIKHVLLSIVRGISKEHDFNKSTDELIPIVHEYMGIGKFFIVMDNVRSVETWNEIKDKIMPCNKMTSKVLITTSNQEMVCYPTHSEITHQLRLLTSKESWELLQLRVFGQINHCPEELEGLGRKIAEGCHGLPLSVLLIAGILRDKYSSTGKSGRKVAWKMTLEQMSLQTLHVSAVTDLYLKDFIFLSVEALPHYLRRCLFYLGIFPEDFEIPVWKLTQLWIAEGFITENISMSLRESAQEILEKLLQMNLLIVDKLSFTGEVKTCRIHDTIREFCSERYNVGNPKLFQEIRFNRGETFEPPVSDLKECYRLCIRSNVLEFLHEKPRFTKAQSFLCFTKAPFILENKYVSHFTDAFGFVRVLEANTIIFRKLSAEVPKLIFLKYLTLSGDELKVIPKAISNLWNLQTLAVNTSSRTLEIEAIIWKMMNLMYLRTNASIFLKQGGGGGGSKIHTITNLSPETFTYDVSLKAKYLKRLGIRGDLVILEHLENLHCLEKLTLKHDVYPKVNSENPLRRLPQPSEFPPCLKFLVLSGTRLDWNDHMSTLEQLDTLEVLKLKDNAFTGSFWNVSDGAFAHLEGLSIEHTELKYWTAPNTCFGTLRSLELKSCAKLQDIPLELGKNLEVLSIYGVTEFAVSCARKIEEDRERTSGFKLQIYVEDVCDHLIKLQSKV